MAMQVSDAPRKPRILLAASGSVAAIKFSNLCSCFTDWAEVKAVATQAALHFIDRTTLPKDVVLYTDEHEWSSWSKIGDNVLHIELRRWADIMVIAPLSANTLGKIAGGLCDNLLTSVIRAWDYEKPIFVAPAMNTFMWTNPFTERHLMTIDELGITLIPPVSKRLACGDYGTGAMAEPSLIFSTVMAMQVSDAPKKPRILLAASGSVAAIKFSNLCSCFTDWAEVKAVATQAALHFIDKTTLPKDVVLYTDEHEWSSWAKIGDNVLHVELPRWADIMVIAPLSANTLGKIAGGLCDNLLTSIIRAWDYEKPMFVAASMNTFMWTNPFTERHLMTIDELGITLIPPVSKRLACGDYGTGAMAEPSLIFSTVRLFLESQQQ